MFCSSRKAGLGKIRPAGSKDVTCWQFLTIAQRSGKRESKSCWPESLSAFTLECCQTALRSSTAAKIRGSDNRCQRHFDFPTSADSWHLTPTTGPKDGTSTKDSLREPPIPPLLTMTFSSGTFSCTLLIVHPLPSELSKH